MCHRSVHLVGLSTENSCLCPECLKLNETKKHQTSDLTGKIALVTGGRHNIGQEVALKLLRANAKVLITTRFPSDTVKRYSEIPDFKEWKDRLEILQCDFRNMTEVMRMIEYINTSLPYLDILINNAAQTIRRPFEYYRGLVDIELEKRKLITSSPELTALIKLESLQDFERAQKHLDNLAGDKSKPEDFPLGELDMNGWQKDLRESNSWNLKADEISLIEFLEVQLVNSTVPFYTCSQLKNLFTKSPSRNKYIVNVAASAEGSFSYPKRNSNHVHLNMAKAAINMLTHTIWRDYKKDGIYVNSVDPGWVNYEGTWKAQLLFHSDNRVPLDTIDGAARILDPIFNDLEVGGKLFKDYVEVPW